MKKITLNNKATKNAVIKITNDILKENVENSKTYIPILDDELLLDEAISCHACYPMKLDDDKEYLWVSLSDIRIYRDEVESEMGYDIEYYCNLKDEFGEPYGDDFQESPEYQEEYKSIEEYLFEKNILPYVIDEINEAIKEYNNSNEE